MTNSPPLHIVFIGHDSTVFEPHGASDTLARMLAYTSALQRIAPEGRISYLVFGKQAASYSEGGFTALSITGNRLQRLLKLWQALRSLHRATPIHVVASQTPYEEAVPADFFCHAHKIPHVVQVHDDLLRGGLLHRLRRAIAGWIIPRAQLVRCVNPVMQADLQKLYPQTPVAFLPVPITLEVAPPAPATPPAILFVGRLAPEKNLPLWLHTAALIHKARPDVTFDIVGPGETTALAALGQQLGIASKLHFHGPVPSNALGAFYSRASIFLLTSKHEGFGRVLVEAMMHHVPVVCTHTAGTAAILEGQEAGLLVREHTAPALANALLPLLNEPALHQKFAQAGYAVAQHYSPQAAIAEWIEALVTLADGRPVHAPAAH